MLTSVQGIYHKGKIKFEKPPEGIQDDMPVIVTFLESGAVDLSKRGIKKTQAEALRAQLESFAEEWDSPEMSAYDNYDAAKAKP